MGSRVVWIAKLREISLFSWKITSSLSQFNTEFTLCPINHPLSCHGARFSQNHRADWGLGRSHCIDPDI